MSTPLADAVRKVPVDYDLANAVKSDVKYRFYTNASPDGIDLNENNYRDVNINASFPIKVLVHGWNANVQSYWYENCRNIYLQKGEYNIIEVDWMVPACKEYPISAANVKPIGCFVGDFLVACKVDLRKVHVISKALGSHAASWIGKRVKELTSKKINRITGLDPASLQFENDAVDVNERLNRKDAEFVDVIHTDAGCYGFIQTMGTVDFYPNGGGLQPGCTPDDEGHGESHERSLWYFLESIDRRVQAVKALSWSDFLEGNFDKNDSIQFGEDVPQTATGVYYLETNAEKPYLISTS